MYLIERLVKRTVVVATILTCATVLAMAAEPASQADKDFVGKVSQGGLYEVEAGKVAAMRGSAPAVKNFGTLDVHDHEGVNMNLKRIAAATGVPIKPGLNAEFTARLARLKAVPADKFDAYYIGDMKDIHNGDEKLFQQEATDGTAAYKDFAHNTAILVAAHLGWLNTL